MSTRALGGERKVASYQSLKQVFHEARTNSSEAAKRELKLRLSNPATLTYPYQVGGNGLFVLLYKDLHALTETVWRRELVIQKLWNELPPLAKTYLLDTLLVEEIQSTNEIENVQSSRQEVLEALDLTVQDKASNAPKRFKEMASTFKLLLEDSPQGALEFPKTLDSLRSLYDQLLGAEIEDENQPDGDLFRAGPVSIWGGANTPIHTGVSGEDEIKSRLSVMLNLAEDSDAPNLANAFVAHFIVEHTHPFYDGNGRFGRFLLALKLKEILSLQTALSLSAEVMRQKGKYYKAFVKAEDSMNLGEATFFVSDMLEILAAAQENLEQSLRERARLLSDLNKRVEEISKGRIGVTAYQADMLFMLGQVLLFGPRSGASLDEVARFLGRSKGTARRQMRDLTELGFVEEISKRPLVFSLTEEGKAFLKLEIPSFI